MEENLNTLTAEEPTGLERLDAYIGTVVDSCRSGIFIRLEDGQVVYDGDAHAPEAVVQPTLSGEAAQEEAK